MNKFHVIAVPTSAHGTTTEWRIAAVDRDVLVVDTRFPPGRDKDAYLLVADALNRDEKKRRRTERAIQRNGHT